MGKRKFGIALQCPFREIAHLLPLVRTNVKRSHLLLSLGQSHGSRGEPTLVQSRGDRKHFSLECKFLGNCLRNPPDALWFDDSMNLVCLPGATW